MKKNRFKTLILALVGSFALVFVFSGCGDNGTFEDAGEEIDEAIEDAEEELDDAID